MKNVRECQTISLTMNFAQIYALRLTIDYHFYTFIVKPTFKFLHEQEDLARLLVEDSI